MGTLVYQYGLLPPIENADIVREQMRLAHRYRNTLVEIERGRRAAVRALEDPETLAVANEAIAAEEEVILASRAIKETRSESRSRSETADMRKALVEAKKRKKVVVDRLRELRRRNAEATASERSIIEERASELRKSARAHCGVYWGTYLLIEDAAERARKSTPLYMGAHPNDPGFSRWDGHGRVGVQIQNGMTVGEAVSCEDTRLRIHVSDGAKESFVAKNGKTVERKRMSTIRVRVGSDGRAPVWATFPIVMHRPLPEGAIIKGVSVSMHRVGPHEKWTCEVTIDMDREMRKPSSDRAVAIDVGWRAFGDQIRVATWTDGEEVGELRLDSDLVGLYRKIEDLDEIRDKSFNRAIADLRAWLSTATVPEWMQERTKHIAQWASQGRLASLAIEWRSNRFEGDEEAFARVEAWRKQDKHLWCWEAAARGKAYRRRREVYRIFASQLASKYAHVILERFDLREPAKKRPLEEGKKENSVASRNRTIAAVSEFRAAIKNACGDRICEVDASDTTRTCNSCGHVDKWDQAEMIHHACSKCGVVWDQDENAAVNILSRWRERPSDGSTPGTARKGKRESKWSRLKRERAERAAVEGTAREAGDEAAE